MADALRELLERAVALKEQVAELKTAGTIEAQVAPVVETPPDLEEAATVEQLTAIVAELEDTVFALTNSTPGEPAEEFAGSFALDPDAAAEPDGTDFDVFDDLDGGEPGAETTGMVETPAVVPEVEGEKSWNPCTTDDCAASDVDEFKDGSARCADCGTLLEAKVDDPAGELETKAEGVEETKADEGTTSLSEIELLMHRRQALDA